MINNRRLKLQINKWDRLTEGAKGKANFWYGDYKSRFRMKFDGFHKLDSHKKVMH